VGSLPNRRITQRNLYSVLGLINHDRPADSPLLQAPIRPHGTARAPIFTDRSLAQYKQMVDWVYRVAQAPPPSEAGTAGLLGSPDPAVQPAAYESPFDAERDSAEPGKFAGFSGERAAAVPTAGRSSPKHGRSEPVRGARRSEHSVKPGASAPPTAADPFDPEVFNRRFGASSQPVPAAVPLPNPEAP
jgi:hypothetical protein